MTVWRLWVCGISVCLMPKFEMSVCRMSVIYVGLGNDCLAVVDVRHLCVFNAHIWNVCLQKVSNKCPFGEWLCGYNIFFCNRIFCPRCTCPGSKYADWLSSDALDMGYCLHNFNVGEVCLPNVHVRCSFKRDISVPNSFVCDIVNHIPEVFIMGGCVCTTLAC